MMDEQVLVEKLYIHYSLYIVLVLANCDGKSILVGFTKIHFDCNVSYPQVCTVHAVLCFLCVLNARPKS